MKTKILLFISFCLVLFASCKKDSNNATGTLVATVNGTPLTFNVFATAIVDTASGSYGVVIVGLQSLAVTSKQIDIAIGDGSIPITAGTYTDTSTTGHTGLLGYANNADSAAWTSTDVAPNISTVTITSISATEIKGTFSGQLELAEGSDPGPATATVTNGSFDLHVTQYP